ncbi:MAG: TRAM domain-containing protein [Kofleriaceae bacterium]
MTELTIASLAAGGDGVGRDDAGRVTFVPLTAPGDRVRVELSEQKKSFARGELVEVLTASPDRVEPPCPYFKAGCGGCQWQHVSRDAQLAAKHAIVVQAFKRLAVPVEPIVAPAPPLGWRRRARFHVEAGRVGLYHRRTNRILALAHCPQLEPALDAAYAAIVEAGRHAPLPDGDLALLRGHQGDIAIAFERPWRAAATLVGKAGIVGILAGDVATGTTAIEVEPGLVGTPWDFAQASTDGNAALIGLARSALGPGPGNLLELYAGAGNFTRGFTADGWTVTPSDVVAPPRMPPRFHTGHADRVLAQIIGRGKDTFDAIVLDPPRAGAAEAIDGIVKLAPKKLVYISCDPATLARDATRLVEAGYRTERAWPLDLMPKTAHVEVVMQLAR